MMSLEKKNSTLKRKASLRKLSEEKITFTQAQLTAILNNSTDIILSIDKNYNIVLFNQLLFNMVKARYGVELIEGKPFPVLEIMEPGQRDGIRKIYEQVFLEGKNVVAVEMFVASKDRKLYFE